LDTWAPCAAFYKVVEELWEEAEDLMDMGIFVWPQGLDLER
jgi:hypothetical protein